MNREGNAAMVERVFTLFLETGQAQIRGALGTEFDRAADRLGELGSLMQRMVSPDVVIDVTPLRGSFLEGRGRFEGHTGWAEYWTSWLEPWDDFDFDNGPFEAHGDHVVVDTVIKARGRESGVPVEWPMTQVWSFREGMLVRLSAYDSRDQALKAIGSQARQGSES